MSRFYYNSDGRHSHSHVPERRLRSWSSLLELKGNSLGNEKLEVIRVLQSRSCGHLQRRAKGLTRSMPSRLRISFTKGGQANGAADRARPIVLCLCVLISSCSAAGWGSGSCVLRAADTRFLLRICRPGQQSPPSLSFHRTNTIQISTTFRRSTINECMARPNGDWVAPSFALYVSLIFGWMRGGIRAYPQFLQLLPAFCRRHCVSAICGIENCGNSRFFSASACPFRPHE